MNITLYLCRHGNTFEADQTPVQVGAKTDLPLTQTGLAQGIALGKFFAKQVPIHHIYAGPLKRQMQTAEQIQNQLGEIEVSIMPLLDEIDYGDWEGLSSQAIAARWSESYRLWTEKQEWANDIFAESKKVYQLRLSTFLENLKSHHANQTVIAVTSNGILQLLHGLISNDPHTAKVKTGNWCKLNITDNETTILNWNEAPC